MQNFISELNTGICIIFNIGILRNCSNYISDLTLDLDANKKATTRAEGATLTCQASIEFPPFSMLSLIKNGETLSSSTNSSLQIYTRSVNTSQFGLYTCQLNASGVKFQKSYVLKEQGTMIIDAFLTIAITMLNSLLIAANLRMTLDNKNSSICSNSVSFIDMDAVY